MCLENVDEQARIRTGPEKKVKEEVKNEATKVSPRALRALFRTTYLEFPSTKTWWAYPLPGMWSMKKHWHELSPERPIPFCSLPARLPADISIQYLEKVAAEFEQGVLDLGIETVKFIAIKNGKKDFNGKSYNTLDLAKYADNLEPKNWRKPVFLSNI